MNFKKINPDLNRQTDHLALWAHPFYDVAFVKLW